MSVRGRDGETRHRILVEASSLFAQRGYWGTSTRDIAGAVGIRQPSLYNHFPTKHAVLAELVDADLLPALARLRAAAELDAPVAVRLHAYLRGDVYALLRLPFDVRGLYDDAVLALPELVTQAKRRDELHRRTVELVAEGVANGELTTSDPLFVQRAITGLLLEMVRDQADDDNADPGTRGLLVADFVLRATLTNLDQLSGVRRRSTELLDEGGPLALVGVT